VLSELGEMEAEVEGDTTVSSDDVDDDNNEK
jgi:hypothetical protein